VENATGVPCSNYTCADSDQARCCVKRGKCSDYNCPCETVNVGGTKFCAGAVCNKTDEDICCEAPATPVVVRMARVQQGQPTTSTTSTTEETTTVTTATTVVPTEIVPQKTQKKSGPSAFVVFCIVLLGGALCTLIGVAMTTYGGSRDNQEEEGPQ
jgi:hypothetical protein